jgi:hypothetical protein
MERAIAFAGKSDGQRTCQMQEAVATYAVTRVLNLYEPITGTQALQDHLLDILCFARKAVCNSDRECWLELTK